MRSVKLSHSIAVGLGNSLAIGLIGGEHSVGFARQARPIAQAIDILKAGIAEAGQEIVERLTRRPQLLDERRR